MVRMLRLAHFAGLAMFLGSISTFVLISVLTEGTDLENLAFARRIISTGTNVLTLPGMWLLAVTGLLMGLRHNGPSTRFFQLKLLLVAAVVVNAHFVVAPAVASATQLAIQSAKQGWLLPGYGSAYMRESVFGALNVVLTIAAATVAVWKIGARSKRP